MTPNRRASRNTSNKHRGRARAVARRSVCVRAEIRCGRDETVSVERDMNHDLIAFTLAVRSRTLSPIQPASRPRHRPRVRAPRLDSAAQGA